MVRPRHVPSPQSTPLWWLRAAVVTLVGPAVLACGPLAGSDLPRTPAPSLSAPQPVPMVPHDASPTASAPRSEESTAEIVVDVTVDGASVTWPPTPL